MIQKIARWHRMTSRARRSSVPAYGSAFIAACRVDLCHGNNRQGVIHMRRMAILSGLVLSVCALSIAAGDIPDGRADVTGERRMSLGIADVLRYPDRHETEAISAAGTDHAVFGNSKDGVVFDDDFDDGDISDWTITMEGSGEVTVEQYPGPDWSLNTDSPSGTSSRAQAVSPVFEMEDSLDYDVSLEFAFEEPIHWIEVFRNKHINTVIDNCPGDYCTFRCRYGGSNYIIDNLYPYTFYSIDYKVHPESGNYDVYVGGVLKRTCDCDLSSIPFPQFRIGDFESGSGNYGMAMYDDFVVVQEPAGVKETGPAPAGCGLRQNRPNPFRAATAIIFDMPEPSFVTLKVYDVRGGLVKTLVHQMHPASTHAVRWAADDEMGHRVGPGTYFVRIETETFTETKKMILLK